MHFGWFSDAFFFIKPVNLDVKLFLVYELDASDRCKLSMFTSTLILGCFDMHLGVKSSQACIENCVSTKEKL